MESWVINPPDVLIMYNLEASLDTTVDNTCVNSSVSTVKSFNKHFGHPEYSMDGTVPPIAVSVPHEYFFNSAVGYGSVYFLKWNLQTNQDAKSMEILRTKSA